MSVIDSFIPYNKPYLSGNELDYIKLAHEAGKLSGDGPYTKYCHQWLKEHIKTSHALLTHSCTAALEMCALLLNIGPGDEVIMPSYTFVSTANAFVLRGATPVFVDIRPDTLNIDESLLEEHITNKTKAIVVVHYAGVSCDMDSVLSVSKKYDIPIIEDAAQGINSFYKGKSLGSIGSFGCLSFHETKNVISGEGGALLINDDKYAQRAEIIREKGTNRSMFFKGLVDKYTWCDIGSSYLPGELVAAFLWAQLQNASDITSKRLEIWNRYHSLLEQFETADLLRRPIVPNDCQTNAHIYYVILKSQEVRDSVLHALNQDGIGAVFHYIPLHSSPAGKTYGKTKHPMANTDELSGRLLRLPLWVGLQEGQQTYIVERLASALK